MVSIAKQPQGRKPACIPTNLGADFPDPWVPHRSEGAAGPTGNEQDRPRLQHSPENSQSRTKVKQHLLSQKLMLEALASLFSGVPQLGHSSVAFVTWAKGIVPTETFTEKTKLLLILRKLSVAEKDT